MRHEPASQFQEEFRSDVLGGIVMLKHVGAAYEKLGSGSGLYYSYTANAPKGRQVELRFIPYYAWANRAGTPMQDWTPILRA